MQTFSQVMFNTIKKGRRNLLKMGKMNSSTHRYFLNHKGVFTAANLSCALLVIACVTVSLCCADDLLPNIDDPEHQAVGRITLPLVRSLTGNRVDVNGYTKNLNSENIFVWLVVDNPEKRLCWPQNVKLPVNCRFSTTINITGHVNACILSLYTVDTKLNERILSWLSSAESKGLPLFPQDTRLHSIRLWNQKIDM